jgi:glycogen operon protein
VNFVTAHDGFTLHDLVSYEHKHNEANGEDNRDGANDNESNNHGIEGPTDDAAVLDARGRASRAMLATLLFSHGTPMLLGGDEFGRTQQGNNNAYCQDNEISWFDWKRAQTDDGRALTDYVARLIRLREQHPTLRADGFMHGGPDLLPGLAPVAWFNERGNAMREDDWNDAQGRLLMLRRACPKGKRHIDVTLLLINGTGESHGFTLPEPRLPWRLRVDSGHPEAPERNVDEATIELKGSSVMLLSAAPRQDGA